MSLQPISRYGLQICLSCLFSILLLLVSFADNEVNDKEY